MHEQEMSEQPVTRVRPVRPMAWQQPKLATSPLDLANALRVTALAMEASMKPGDATSLWREAGMLYAEAGVGEGVAECERCLSFPL